MKLLVSLCLMLSLPLAAHAAGAPTSSRPAVPAGSYEAGASQVTLPPVAVGQLSINRDCDSSCAPFSFLTSPTTSFEVGEAQPVGLAELKRQLGLHPKSSFLVVLDSDYKHVKLVRLILPEGSAR